MNAQLIQRKGAEFILGTNDSIPVSVVLVIPGAGKAYSEHTNFQFNGRVEKAVEFIHRQGTQKIILSGFHDLNEYAETTDLKNALVAKGVNANTLELDSNSEDTFQTILYLRKTHASQTLIFASQKEHLQRILWIANSLGLHAYGVVAKGRPGGTHPWMLARERMACVKARLDVVIYRITGKRIPAIENHSKV